MSITQSFSMSLTEQPEGVVATLKGMASVGAREEFDAELLKIRARMPRLVVLDLSGLEFLTSHALGSFLALHAEVKARGGAVRIAAPSDYIKSLMQATRVDQKLKVFATVADALKG